MLFRKKTKWWVMYHSTWHQAHSYNFLKRDTIKRYLPRWLHGDKINRRAEYRPEIPCVAILSLWTQAFLKEEMELVKSLVAKDWSDSYIRVKLRLNS